MTHLRQAWARRIGAWVPGPGHLPNGMRVSTGGDAVPGGYNGYVAAFTSSGEKVGYVDYQTARGDDEVGIAYIHVEPEYRGQGVASQLIEYMLRYETPHMTLDWGYTTPDGMGLADAYRGPMRIDP